MLKTFVSIMALALLTTGVVLAADGHAHKSPHGGMVATAGKYHVEIVRTDKGYDVFLLDQKEATLPIAGITGKATCLTADKKKLEINLMEGTDRLMIMTDPETLDGGTLIVALQKGSEAISAKFKPVEAKHPNDEPHPHH